MVLPPFCSVRAVLESATHVPEDPPTPLPKATDTKLSAGSE